MKITLSQPLEAASAADPFDVRQMKKILNRLGYYSPYEKTGITGIPDADMFAALKKFQADNNLAATGSVRPDDDTVTALNAAASRERQGTYIWRTVSDDKVRAAHAELNGTVRSWSDSPDPGEDYNCRCWAEEVKEEEDNLEQIVISSMQQSSYKWTNNDFIEHAKSGNGREVTLPEIGWLVEIIWHAREIMFHKVEKQLAELARTVQSGSLGDTWENTYDFKEVVYSIGDAIVRGRFEGTVEKTANNRLAIKATAYYLLDDEFTDPANIRETFFGTSDPSVLADNYFGEEIIYATDFGNKPYKITGTWITEIKGTILNTIKE